MPIITTFCLIIYVFFILFIISGLFKHKNLQVACLQDMPFVSVVIAARNEEDFISDLITDLIAQEYPLEKLEVIIVNDRSNDSTLDILNKAENNYELIKVITVNEKSSDMAPKKHALSLGIESAKGEIIVLTDADCRVGKLWVSSMVYSVINQNSIVIGFSQIYNDFNNWFVEYQKIDFFSIIVANTGSAGWGYFWSGTGQNLAFYKNDFNAISGFNPVKNRISGDDMYLVQKISKIRNAYVNIDPNSFVKTSPMLGIKEFINQRVRWSSNSKINLKEAPAFFMFLITMFFFNSLILSFFLLGKPWMLLFLIKFIFDGAVVFLGGKLFNIKNSAWIYCLWSIMQPLYIPIIGLLGLRGKFSWKK